MANAIVPVASILFAAFVVSLHAGKPLTLNMLALVPLSGSGPQSGRGCMNAMQVAIDAVNQNEALLPEFEVRVTFRDEGTQAILAPKSFMEFINSFTSTEVGNGSKAADSRKLMSPMVIGSWYQCNTWTKVASAMRMVQFSQSCSGPTFTANRREYPNLYRFRSSLDLLTVAFIYLVKSIGKWRQVAIMSNAANFQTHVVAQRFYSLSVEAGIDVVWFNSISDVDRATIDSLKDSGARVLAVFVTEATAFNKLLCFTHRYGVKAPRYAIILLATTYFDPNKVDEQSLPSGCTRQTLFEQLRIVFWAGAFTSAISNNGNTSLGYDQKEFERRFDNLAQGVALPDYSSRHSCHDAAEGALLTLHAANELLKSQYNKTIGDFEKAPETVMNAVNGSAAKLDMVGLRIGHMVYSPRLELDSEPLFVAQSDPADGSLRIIAKLMFTGQVESGQLFNTSLYKVERFARVLWWTQNKQPIKDLSSVVHIYTRFSPDATIATTVIGCLISLISLVWGLLRRKILSISGKAQLFSSYSSASMYLLSGCCLNLSAILFVVDIQENVHSSFASLICSSRVAFVVLGLLSQLAMNASELAWFSAAVQMDVDSTGQRKSSSARLTNRSWFQRLVVANNVFPQQRTVSQFSSRRLSTTDRPRGQEDSGSKTVIVGCISHCVSICLLIGWLLSGGYKLVEKVEPVFFNEVLDSYEDIRTVECYSKYETIWFAVFGGSFGVVAIFGVVNAINTWKTKFPSQTRTFELRIVRFCLINTITVVVACSAIIGILSATEYLIRRVVLASCLFFLSVTSITVRYYPYFI